MCGITLTMTDVIQRLLDTTRKNWMKQPVAQENL